jgi:hypothetical protein
MKSVIDAFVAFLNPSIPRTLVVVYFCHSSWNAITHALEDRHLHWCHRFGTSKTS